ncbi:hypothetical protein BHM03_00014245 [Ensete ventricosum]|nr:hypothetical protein BHM03_00014245 [Ensete ventricosum]
MGNFHYPLCELETWGSFVGLPGVGHWCFWPNLLWQGRRGQVALYGFPWITPHLSYPCTSQELHRTVRWKLCGISLSWISKTKGESTIELSPSSSFDLTNSFCTSFKYQLISRNCALRELVKSQEKVYGSVRLGVEVLEASVDRSAIAPRGLEGNSGGSCKLLMSSCRGPRALLVEQGGPAVLLGRFVAGVPLVVPIEGCEG